MGLGPEVFADFKEWITPDYKDADGNLVSWHKRPLLPNAPQSAIDAFNEYKELMKWAEENHVYF